MKNRLLKRLAKWLEDFILPIGKLQLLTFRASRVLSIREPQSEGGVINEKPMEKIAGFFRNIFSPKNVKKLKTYCTTQYLFKPLRLNSFKELSDTGNDQANHT